MLYDTMMAYTEIDEILNQLDKKYVEKIPQGLRELFKEEKIKTAEEQAIYLQQKQQMEQIRSSHRIQHNQSLKKNNGMSL